MKLISWNIDSLNAALTSDSARAKLSQEVLQTLVAENADIIAIQETKLSAKGPTKKHLENFRRNSSQATKTRGVLLKNLLVKAMLEPCSFIKKELTPTVTFPEIGAPSTMDLEGRIITLELMNFS